MSSSNVERWVDLVDRLTFQAYYRTLGVVSMHAPLSEVFPAAQEVARRRRGGTVEWVVPGRLAFWSGIDVNPLVPGTVRMSMWMLRSVLGDKNVAFIRFGWWANYALPDIDAAKNVEGFFKTRLAEGPVFRWLRGGS